jgi:hypothetical protein
LRGIEEGILGGEGKKCQKRNANYYYLEKLLDNLIFGGHDNALFTGNLKN